ncbi:hypothetical protein [Imhoffiella purpurea]|uniref:hypothetical protein n=1 Tax=Imhoffiella purpurea TaxID=1249627 RepID=UPI0012FE24B8|nr:hypothetical protein [Imhoffiella purpurea]
MIKSLLALLLLSSFSVVAVADRFPSQDELDGIIKGCGIGVSNKIQADVSASVKSWRKAAVKGEASYSELGAILQESHDGTISSGNYKTYTSCVIDLVREFNKPLPPLPASSCSKSSPCAITTDTGYWVSNEMSIRLELVAIDVESSPLSPVAYFRNSLGMKGFHITGSGNITGYVEEDGSKIPVTLSVLKIVIDEKFNNKTHQNVSGKVLFALEY